MPQAGSGSPRPHGPLRAALTPLLVLLALAVSLLAALAPTSALAAVGAPAAGIPAASSAGRASNSSTAAGAPAAVSAGGEHSCEVRAGGTLFCWGRNTYGQLGNAHMGPGLSTPQQVPGTGWTQVSAGGAHTCGIRTGGLLYCWGLDHRGQLGDGDHHALDVPRAVGRAHHWQQVAAGWYHTCAVTTDHRLWCWGDNAVGELGRGNVKQDLHKHRVPGSTWRSVSVGGTDTCAIRTDGSLWCWGRNTFGQLGTGDVVDRARPTRVGSMNTWVQVVNSWTHTCGRTRNGQVRCWGRNDLGQAGVASPTYLTGPALVGGDHVARSVAVAEGSSCLVDTASQTWCWGDNRFGQVSSQQPASPGIVTPVQRAGTAAVTDVSGGWYHFCARDAQPDADGAGATCWGLDERGQLGSSGATASPPPAPAPAAQAKRDGALTLRLANFNTLGNYHSSPGRDADRYAPARVRADWEAQAILNNRVGVAALEEQDAGQLAAILAGSQGRLASYPAPSAGDLAVETAVVWDRTQYQAVETSTVRVQFIGRAYDRPVVRLRQLSTGREFYVFGVHNAPREMQNKRNQALAVELPKVRDLEQSGLPVFFVGDFNEKASLYCLVVGQTGLGSASGGRVGTRNGTGRKACSAPRADRVDWIFGSRDSVTWKGFTLAHPPLVRLSTDHWLPVVDVTAS